MACSNAIIIILLIIDNPITAPGVELGQAMTDSTNSQFRFETREKLEAQLQLEYDVVLDEHSYIMYCVVLDHCTVYKCLPDTKSF